MKKLYLFVLFATLVAVFFLLKSPFAIKTTQAQTISKRDNLVAGELLIKFKSEADLANLNSLHAETGAFVKKEFSKAFKNKLFTKEDLDLNYSKYIFTINLLL